MVRRRKKLNDEEHALWKKVTDSVTPLMPQMKMPLIVPATKKNVKPKTLPGLEKFSNQPKKAPMIRHKPTNHHSMIPKHPSTNLPLHHSFDHKTQKKIARGRLPIEARIDLHGMTQEQAITALRRFIHMAHASDYRLVLVITGKGEAGQGILRRRVPDWLSTGELASMVGGVQEAHIGHGGAGALYVRVKRGN